MGCKDASIYLGLMGVVSLVEYWLGKTKKVRANSLLELSVFLTVGLMALLAQRIHNARNKRS